MTHSVCRERGDVNSEGKFQIPSSKFHRRPKSPKLKTIFIQFEPLDEEFRRFGTWILDFGAFLVKPRRLPGNPVSMLKQILVHMRRVEAPAIRERGDLFHIDGRDLR